MRKMFMKAALAVMLFNAPPVTGIAQWASVYNDHDASFKDAAFPTDATGYVAASDTGGAVLLRTADGGLTWNKKYIPEWAFIDKIAMIDSLNGYLIKGGTPVELLKTNDGFNTYTIFSLDASFVVQSLQLLNDSTGFYLNNEARLRKFEHNGASFSSIIDTLSDGQNLEFVSPLIGYLDNGTRLLKTTDAGASWNYINNDLGFYTSTFCFADAQNGYFSDAGKIFKTSDGGLTFSPSYLYSGVYSFAAKGNFCIAANDAGNVAYTGNGGITWQEETTGIQCITSGPYKVVMTPGGNCFLFSQSCGEIRKRTAGATGVFELSEKEDLLIYPNPFSVQIMISFGKQLDHAVLRVTDISGQEIKNIAFSGTKLLLDRGAMPSGVYFFTIWTPRNKVIVSRKVVIQ